MKNLTLKGSIDSVWVIAHKENTEPLEQSLTSTGLAYTVLRQDPKALKPDRSPSYLCLMNHHYVWTQAAAAQKPTLVIEGDFVPVRDLGSLRLPFPIDDERTGISWLYTCAAQVYSVDALGFAEGFSVSTVAYLITPLAARALLDLKAAIEAESGEGYSSWDSQVDGFLRDRGFKNYIARRNYGEHGGKPNPEHRAHGLSAVHRADVLAGPLAFVPPYGERWPNRLQIRVQARIKGLGRLLTGRFLRGKILRNSSTPWRLLGFSIGRQVGQ